MKVCRYCGETVPEKNPPLLKNFCNNNHRLFYKREGPRKESFDDYQSNNGYRFPRDLVHGRSKR